MSGENRNHIWALCLIAVLLVVAPSAYLIGYDVAMKEVKEEGLRFEVGDIVKSTEEYNTLISCGGFDGTIVDINNRIGNWLLLIQPSDGEPFTMNQYWCTKTSDYESKTLRYIELIGGENDTKRDEPQAYDYNRDTRIDLIGKEGWWKNTGNNVYVYEFYDI